MLVLLVVARLIRPEGFCMYVWDLPLLLAAPGIACQYLGERALYGASQFFHGWMLLQGGFCFSNLFYQLQKASII